MKKVVSCLFVLLLSVINADSFLLEEVGVVDRSLQQDRKTSVKGNEFIVSIPTSSESIACSHAETFPVEVLGAYLSQNNGKTWQHILEKHKISYLFLDKEDNIHIVTAREQVFRVSSLQRNNERVEFLNFAPTKSKTSPKWGPVLNDIMSHEVDQNNYSDLVTLAHETSHGIHAHIRNKMNKTGKIVNGFYVLENRAVVVVEPNMRKSKVASYIPPSLRGSRYYTYVSGAPSWDDRPLYIWDEWNAYVNGSEAAVDLENNNLWKYGWRDAMMGTIEFVVYSIGVAMAAEDHAPDYFHNNVQFREFLKWNVKRSMEVFKAGYQIEHFKYEKQETYYQNMKQNPDAEGFRQFCRGFFGIQWTKENLGF